MSKAHSSREHHWWPVGLQAHWKDENGEISWIKPDGSISKKKVKNRKIGYKSHGHTALRGSVWQSNFESEFVIDNHVNDIIYYIEKLRPKGGNLRGLVDMLIKYISGRGSISDACNYYYIDGEMRNNILLFILSLSIRSPASRERFESYPKLLDLPPDEEIGKMNMRQSYMIAKEIICKSRPLNGYFTFVHAINKYFVYGDGSLDTITAGLSGNSINGKILLPLTPRICVYFKTLPVMWSDNNCASVYVSGEIVDKINAVTQIYSKEFLFFKRGVPELIPEYRGGRLMQYEGHRADVLDLLDDIPGKVNPHNPPFNRGG